MLGKPSIFINKVSRGTEFWVSLIVLVARWPWKGYLLVTFSKPCLCTFIGQVLGRQSFKTFFSDWTWSCYDSFSGKSVILRKPCLCIFIVQVSKRQSFEAFSQERELWIKTIVLVGRCLEKAIHHRHRETSAHLFRSPRGQNIWQEIEFCELVYWYLKDGLEKAICQ